MISALIYNEDSAENTTIENVFRKTAGFDDLGRIFSSTVIEALKKQSAQIAVSDELVMCADFVSDGRAATSAVRSGHTDVSVIVLADVSTPPFDYITPEIMPSGVILRPVKEQNVSTAMRSVIEAIRTHRRAKVLNNEVFVIRSKEESIRVPYAEVLYFEAREKKVFLCTRKREYPFYSTLDKVMEEIPDFFVRCHKGYIVNTLMVERASFSENMLMLQDGFSVPVSRGCKQEVKEVLSCYIF